MNNLELIYSYCQKNKHLLKKYQKCLCLYCGKTFIYQDIKEWIDYQKTALCPYCYIDSVVPSKIKEGQNEYNITPKLQEKIKQIYFGG